MNPFDILKNFNVQDMQNQINQMQDKMNNITAEGSAGGGMVKITVNGKFEVTDVYIEPEIIDPEEPKMLQDLVKAAFIAAVSNIKDKIQQESLGGMNPGDLSGMFGGMNQ